MKHIRIASAVALALAISACGNKANKDNAGADVNAAASDTAMSDSAVMPPPATTPGQTTGQMAGQDFANAMAASDTFEIESSRLAATQAKAASVKSFAQQMIKAHTESTTRLKQAAGNANPAITAAPALKPEQRQLLDSLKNKNGEDFDTAYAAAQVTAHQQALEILRSCASNGDVASLKTFASQTAPVVAAHLNMAKGLKPGA